MLALLIFVASGCSTREASHLAPAGAINWVLGEYHCGESSSPYGSLHITVEQRFILSVRTAPAVVERVTGRVITKRGFPPVTSVRWIDLVPDTRYAQVPIPRRLYVTQGDSYQVLANYPFSPQQRGQRSLPSDYLHFPDGTSMNTPTRFQDVLRLFKQMPNYGVSSNTL